MEITEWGILMRHTKTGYIHPNFWHGILVCFVVVCSFLASAEEHNTQSETQETPQAQNQNLPQVTRQDIRDINTRLIEQQEMLTNHFTRSIVILGILLFVILISVIWAFFRYRNLVDELDSLKHQIGRIEISSSSLKRDLSDIGNRIQKLAKTSDVEKLSTENQDGTQEILKLLKLVIDKAIVEGSSLSQEKLESSEQIAEDTSDLKLTPAIADLCDRYNAGIQDKNKRNDFLQRYHNSYKIYVENATDRRVKQQIDPVFKTHHAAGNFLGCYVEEERLYALVPAYQLRIEYNILHYGAFVDVFECYEHEFDDPNSCYEVVRIIKPAIFEPDDGKETWKLESKGILELKEV